MRIIKDASERSKSKRRNARDAHRENQVTSAGINSSGDARTGTREGGRELTEFFMMLIFSLYARGTCAARSPGFCAPRPFFARACMEIASSGAAPAHARGLISCWDEILKARRV